MHQIRYQISKNFPRVIPMDPVNWGLCSQAPWKGNEEKERKKERKTERKSKEVGKKGWRGGGRGREGTEGSGIEFCPPPLTKSWIRHGLIMSIDCTKSYACSSTAFCKPSRNLYGRRHKSRNVLIYWAQNVHNAMTIGSLSATAVLSVSVGNNRYH